MVEYPDRSVQIDLVKVNPDDPMAYDTMRVRYSREALEIIVPQIQEWFNKPKI